jgi:hypothetical protein
VNQQATNYWSLLSGAGLEIGGDDQLSSLREKHSTEPADDERRKRFQREWELFLTDLHIQSGTLLKTDNVSFLLGAAASKECGGPLISTIPPTVERALLGEGIAGESKP